MRLAIREILQLSERCFSAAGFPPGVARANAVAIWWTELYDEAGLTTLHGLLDDLPDLSRDRVGLEQADTRSVVLDSSDQPSIASTAPALDLCCARAEQHGFGVAYAAVERGDPTAPVLVHLAAKAAERGLVGVVGTTDGTGDARTIVGIPDEPKPALATADLDGPARLHRTISAAVSGGLDWSRDDPLVQSVLGDGADTVARTMSERVLDGVLDQATTPAERPGAATPSYFLLCLDPHEPRYPEGLGRRVTRFVENDPAFAVSRPEVVHDRVDRFLQEGVPVERAVWEDIFEFSSGVLAPPFEGSYEGAGFDINE